MDYWYVWHRKESAFAMQNPEEAALKRDFENEQHNKLARCGLYILIENFCRNDWDKIPHILPSAGTSNEMTE